MKVRRWVLITLVVLAFGITMSGCMDVSSQLKDGRISGKIEDQDGRAVGAVVSIDDHQVITGIDGTFAIERITYGTHTASVIIGGKVIHEQQIEVSANQSVFNMTISMDDVDNLLLNPGWEGPEGEMPLGWSTLNSALFGETAFFIDDPESGKRVAVLDDISASGAYSFVSANLPTVPGVEYGFSGMARGDGELGIAEIWLQFFNAGGSRIGARNVKTDANSADWKLLEETREAPDGAVYMNVLLFSGGPSFGEVQFSDIKLEIAKLTD